MADEESGDVSGGTPELKRPLVMPENFTGEDSVHWNHYIKSFEACAELNGWSNEIKCKFLAVKLKNQAAKVFFDLDDDTRKNWLQLKKALEARLDVSHDVERSKVEFLNRVKRPGEKLIDFGNGVRHLSRQAYPTLDSTVRDELACDQFLRGLDNREMVIRVRQGKPSGLDDAIKAAIEYETILNVSENSGRAAECNPPQVVAAASASTSKLEEMMAKMIELMQGKETHSTTKDRTRRCYQCGADTHLKRDCPNVRDRTRRCWNCGQVGHVRQDCTKFKFNPGN